jgi:hypothetical protein
MSYGYSARIIAANHRQDDSSLGVKLGRVCIALDIPVTVVAEKMGVSKQTIYNWFMGAYAPHASCKATVEALILDLDKRK